MWDFLEAPLAKVASIIVSIGTIIGTVPPLRRFFLATMRVIRGYITGPLLLRDIARQVVEIKRELEHNGGGSIKDAVTEMKLFGQRHESFRRHDFWTRGRPAMEMDGHGHVNLSSEALLRLFQVSSPEEVYRRSWLRFLDGEQVDDFVRTFGETAAADSIFRFAIKVRGAHGSDRGEWEFRAVPIKPDLLGEKLYSGHWIPVCGQAKEIARRNGWAAN